MSLTFTKLFSSITESTVWCKPAGTRLTWITMLAMADQHGRVFASIPGLANRARVPLAEAERAITTFLSPDPYSRTPDHEGRRISPIDGGWRLLNHAKYRELRDEESRKAQNRDAKQRQREKEKQSAAVSNSADSQPDVSKNCTKSAQAEANADIEEARSRTRARPAPMVLPSWLETDLWKQWHDYRNTNRGWTVNARELSLRKLTRLQSQGHDPQQVIEQSIECGWKGLFEVRKQSPGVPYAAPRKLSAIEQVQAAIAGRTTAEAEEFIDVDSRRVG